MKLDRVLPEQKYTYKFFNLFSFSICFFLLGCGSLRFKEKMDSWVGQNINSAVLKYGPPVSTFDMPGTSEKMFAWRFENSSSHTAVNYLGQTSIESKQNYCNFRFIVDNTSNTIKSWSSEGNSCSAKMFNSAF